VESDALGVAFELDGRFADVGFGDDPDLPSAHYIASVGRRDRAGRLHW
jgi:hypothetical protein